MIAKYLKLIAPVAIVALAVSGPAIAKDKQKNAEQKTPAVEETRTAPEQSGVAEGNVTEDEVAEEEVTEITIPNNGKEASKGQQPEKSGKSESAKKNSDRQKTAKKPNKKNDG